MANLKNNVEIKREELKLEIDKKSDEMIKKLEKFQEECLQNIELSKIQEKIKKIEDEIAKNQEELDAWSKELNLLFNDETKWEHIKKKADLLNWQLAENLKELNMNLLKDESWKFDNNSKILW